MEILLVPSSNSTTIDDYHQNSAADRGKGYTGEGRRCLNESTHIVNASDFVLCPVNGLTTKAVRAVTNDSLLSCFVCVEMLGGSSKLNLPDHRYKCQCCSLTPAKSNSSPHAHAQAFNVISQKAQVHVIILFRNSDKHEFPQKSSKILKVKDIYKETSTDKGDCYPDEKRGDCELLKQDLNQGKIVGTSSESGGLYLFDLNYIGFSKRDRLSPCNICHKAKQTREPFPLSGYKSKGDGDIIHCDVWGPYRVVSKDGYKLFLTLVDDFSRAVWVYLLKLPSSVLSGVYPYFLVYGKDPSLSHVRPIRPYDEEGDTSNVDGNIGVTSDDCNSTIEDEVAGVATQIENNVTSEGNVPNSQNG
ncbi:ribonuclease H-like domain-containing protein [Tanacetum coccineum]